VATIDCYASVLTPISIHNKSGECPAAAILRLGLDALGQGRLLCSVFWFFS
jgi:hypothetical protein